MIARFFARFCRRPPPIVDTVVTITPYFDI